MKKIKSFFLKKLMLIFCFYGLLVSEVKSAPYNGDVISLKQPDNTEISVRLYGDEYYQRVETTDGYTLIKDSTTGWICYARLNEYKTEFQSTGVIYREKSGTTINPMGILGASVLEKHLKLSKEVVQNRAREVRELLNYDENDSSNIYSTSGILTESTLSKEMGSSLGNKLSGKHRGLTLIIDFSDEEATIPATEIDHYLNQKGYSSYGCNGSVRDYFLDVSANKLDYTNHVTAYYRAENPKSYYTDESLPQGVLARELILEALNWLENQEGFDFTTLSVNGNNQLRALNVFYAGNLQNAWGKGLWPHASSFVEGVFVADGVEVRKYQMTNIGDSLSLRTFVHENGHMLLGWPDLYDYDYTSNGVGDYCIMAYGGNDHNPMPPNPALRNSAGWENLIDITDAPDNSTYREDANSLTTYVYKNKDRWNEYFLIDIRNAEGRNYWIPDEGMIIWHVEEEGRNDHEDMIGEKHYQVSVVQADGLNELENDINRGGADDLFHRGNLDSFNDETAPSASWWWDGPSGLDISHMTVQGDFMEFTVNSKEYEKSFQQVYFRGTSNGWSATPMEHVGDHLWQIKTTFENGDSQGGPRFKFDIYGNWSHNYGDNNNDYYADLTGRDIYVAGGNSYIITFNDETMKYEVTENSISGTVSIGFSGGVESNSPIIGRQLSLYRNNSYVKSLTIMEGDSCLPACTAYDLKEGNWSACLNLRINGYQYSGTGSFQLTEENPEATISIQVEKTIASYSSNFESLFFRGTPNNWTTSEMTLVEDNIWEIRDVTFGSSNSERFKFDVYGDWSHNYGDNNSDGLADIGGSDIYVQPESTYHIRFNDRTKVYDLTMDNL